MAEFECQAAIVWRATKNFNRKFAVHEGVLASEIAAWGAAFSLTDRESPQMSIVNYRDALDDVSGNRLRFGIRRSLENVEFSKILRTSPSKPRGQHDRKPQRGLYRARSQGYEGRAFFNWDVHRSAGHGPAIHCGAV